MKNKFCSVFIAMLIVFTFNVISKPAIAHAYSTSKAEFCIEVNTGRVLYSFNENEKLPMASTTKIVTAISVLENANISDVVTVPKNCTGIEGSSIYLKEGEKLTVKELLYGLMLRSGNDCAETLATYCSGNSKNFATMMNNFAKKVGANDSNFVNPHGLPCDNHYTTAHDLGIISAYAMHDKRFREIVSTEKIRIGNAEDENYRLLINKNKTLYRYDGATGIKTGYTKKAGRCLVSSAKRNGFEVICVVLDSPQMFERSFELLDNCFDGFSRKIYITKEQFEDYFSYGEFGKTLYIDCDVYDVIRKGSRDDLGQIEIIFDTFNAFPIKKGESIAKINIYLSNQLIYSQKIYTLIDIENKKLYNTLQDKAKKLQRCINENKQIFG